MIVSDKNYLYIYKKSLLAAQESVESKDSLQSLSAPVKKEVEPDTKDTKVQGDAENGSKSDNDSSDRDDDDDDYEDDEFPPVHIKLPLQLDLDDIAGVSRLRRGLCCFTPHFCINPVVRRVRILNVRATSEQSL